MMRVLGAVVGSVVAIAAACPAAAAGAATFLPAADSYVAADTPAANFGTSVKLRADGSPVNRSYLRFDVSGLTAPVQKATLRIFNNTALKGGYSVFGVASNAWGEKTITWSNAPPFDSTATATTGDVGASSTTSLDVTPLVSGNGSVSFGLSTASSTAISWQSREGTSSPPQLVVDTGAPPPPPPPPDGDPVVAAAGDIACDPASASYNGGAGTSTVCRQRYTSDLLTGGDLAGVLTLGDNQYENGTLAAYQQSYDPTWGRLKTITRPAVGNHEYQTSAAAGYFDYFNGTGALGGPAGDRGKGYYSYDIGAWHLIVLNSNCSRVPCAAGSAQESWLRADLASHPVACTLAYWHHPLFTSGTDGPTAGVKPLWDALYAGHADLVLNGHDHDYERFAPQTPAAAADPSHGIREFVVGTGGRSQRAFKTVQANSQARNTGTFGVLRLTLHASGYDWRFAPEGGKSFADSGSGACH